MSIWGIALAFGGLALGIVLGAAGGYWRWRREHPFFDQQRTVVLAKAAETPPGALVVFGDSIVARQRFTTLCGQPVLNAGISNARAEDLLGFAGQVVAIVRPGRVILAVGVNDFHRQGRREPTPWPRWTNTMRRLIEELGPGLTIVGLSPGQAPPAANAFLRDEARRVGGTYVDPQPPSMTVDKLHLSAEGARAWKAAIPG